MLTSIWNRITDFFEKNWPLLASGGGGIIIGMFILGKLVSGIKVSTEHGFEVLIDRTKLPTELDIEGDWYNKTETNEAQTRFADDNCRIRLGTVRINSKPGTSEVTLSGRRIVRADCGNNKPNIIGTQISWRSENAVVKQKESELFFWLFTYDSEPIYGYVSANILPQDGKKPSRIHGDMFYLYSIKDRNSINYRKNIWFKTKIDFYRTDSSEGIELKAIYPDLGKG